LKKEIQCTEYATEDLNRVLAVSDDFIRANIQRIADARNVLAKSYADTTGKLIESSAPRPLFLPNGRSRERD
jgi:hypothetical protein